MLMARYAKIVMSLSLAAFCLLVAFDNITDYGTNYLAVQHVLVLIFVALPDGDLPGAAPSRRANPRRRRTDKKPQQ
jgi:predicted small integral membrane protein